MEQKTISSRLIQGIINARAKVNSQTSKSSANLHCRVVDASSAGSGDSPLKNKE